MSNILQEIEKINAAAQNGQRFVEESEMRFRGDVQKVAEQIADDTRIVMLSGPSGSGKTTTAHMLTGFLESMGIGSEVISLDDFYLGKENAPRLPDGSVDFESVHALDLEQLQACMKDIMRKGACDMPKFDFMAGRPQKEKYPIRLGPRDIAIFEGIHAMDPHVTGSLSGDLCKIYISVESSVTKDGAEILSSRSIRLVRRMIRDYIYRNSSPQNTLKMWSGVIHAEEISLFPYSSTADIHINSFHPYEPCVFADEILELLDMVTPTDENAHYALEILQNMHLFTPLPDDLVPEDSLLREFLGHDKT